MTGLAVAFRPLNSFQVPIGALAPAHSTAVIPSEVAQRATQSKAGSPASVLCSLGCKDPCISAESTSSVILSEARSAQSKDPETAGLAKYARTFLPAVLLFALFAAITAHAQGCAQCLDSTRATPPAVQAAYRHAIELLIAAASTIFLIGLYLLRREP
jgi:hypothetical protein